MSNTADSAHGDFGGEMPEVDQELLKKGAKNFQKGFRDNFIFSEDLATVHATVYPKPKEDGTVGSPIGYDGPVSESTKVWLQTVTQEDAKCLERDFDSYAPVVQMKDWIKALGQKKSEGAELLERVRSKDRERSFIKQSNQEQQV